MTKDNKFRNAYIECFNHEPIECIWPETKSECTQEPEIFINVNLIKMLFTKEIVREANASAKKNILLIELTNFRENKDNFFDEIPDFFNAIPDFFNRIFRGKTSKSVEEYQDEINLKIKVESLSNKLNLQGIDHVCINPFDNITDIDNNFKYKKIENPFLINWKSKYIQRTTNSKNEDSLNKAEELCKEEIKVNSNEYSSIEICDVLDPHGLMFTRDEIDFKPYYYISTGLAFDLCTPYYNGPQVKTVDHIVTFQQMNFCGDEYEHDELELEY